MFSKFKFVSCFTKCCKIEKKSDVHLQLVNRGSLEIEEKVDLTFQIGGFTMCHPFF